VGASTTPVAPGTPLAVPPVGAPPVGAPPVGAPPVGTPVVGTPVAAVQPALDFVNGPAVKTMTAKANGMTYEAFKAANPAWTDEQMIAQGYMN
jgi:hypothetical protein